MSGDKPHFGASLPGIPFLALEPNECMSLRDWFAGQALAGLHISIMADMGLLDQSNETDHADVKRLLDESICEGVSCRAYLIADAMLRAREQTEESSK